MSAQGDTVELRFELSHPPEKVWRALTEPKLLEQWLLKTDLHPSVGHRFQFRREAMPHWDGVIECEILDSREPSFLSYTWRALGVDTVVSWTLERSSTGTLLVFTQSGFKTDNKQAIGGARAGWKQMAGQALPKLLDELA